jgi:hypothetical protein
VLDTDRPANAVSNGIGGLLACAANREGSLTTLNRFDDEDDWVGTPPEGRYSRDRAKPDFWWRQRPVGIAAAGILVVVIVLIVVAASH